MKTLNLLKQVTLAVLLIVALAACGRTATPTTVTLSMVEATQTVTAMPPTITPAAEPTEPSSVQTPEEVVDSFYVEWLEYAQTTGNPLVDRVYQSSEYVTEEWVSELNAALNSPDGVAFDPVVCAQDVPTSFTVDPAEISGEQARAIVRTSFENHSFEVYLQRVDGQWKIADVFCRPPDQTQGTAETENSIQSGLIVEATEFGFSMTLPEGWNVVGPEAGPADTRQFFFGPEPEVPSAANSTIVIGDAADQTMEAFIEAVAGVVPPLTDVTLDGVPAKRGRIGGGWLVEFVVVEHGGRLYYLDFHDPETLQPQPELLEAFRFIE